MYAGTGNLSRTTLVEQFMFISRELDAVVSQLLRIMPEDGGLPEATILDKLYRQDIAISKEKVEMAVSRILEFIASGRMGLIDSKEFYISISLGLRRIINYIEGVTHRMLLAKKKLAPEHEIEELSSQVRSLIKILEESLFEISSIIRAFSGISHGNTDLLKSLETKVQKVKTLEEDADEIYRNLLERLLDIFPENYKAYILYEEILDKLEDAIDEVENIAMYMKILSLSTVYG